MYSDILIYIVSPSKGQFYRITSTRPYTRIDGLLTFGLTDEDKGRIFSVLRSDPKIQWSQVYDLVNPFVDERGEKECRTLVILNFKDDTFCYSKGHNKSGKAPLSLLCVENYSYDDFTPCEDPIPLSRTPLDLEKPETFPPPRGSRPELDVCPRRVALVYSILTDFSRQWRHTLRQTYNTATFRRLATAIIRIVTIDFSVRESWGRIRYSQPAKDHVSVTDVPGWEPFDSCMVRVGKEAWFALYEDPAEGLVKVREHAEARRVMDRGSDDDDDDSAETRYWILSVTHIVLCRMVGADGELQWTKPERLFERKDDPSDAALDILLSATTVNTEYPPTPVHSLPVEIQDRILRYASRGPVEAAMQGCVLGLGSEFSWLDGKMVMELEIRPRSRLKNSPVQSSVYFGEWPSGVVYTAISSTRSSLTQGWVGFEF